MDVDRVEIERAALFVRTSGESFILPMVGVLSRVVLVLFGPNGKQELTFQRIHRAGDTDQVMLFEERLPDDDE